MDDNFSKIAEEEGYQLFQSVGDNRTVYVQRGNYRQVWVDGSYIGQYQYAE